MRGWEAKRDFPPNKEFVGITKSRKAGSLPRNGLKLQLVVFTVSHWQEESPKLCCSRCCSVNGVTPSS